MHARIAPTARRGVAAIAIAIAAVGLAGCAAASDDDPAAPAAPSTPADVPAPEVVPELGALPQPLPTGEVVAQGLVLDAGAPVLCLGAVGASLPPSCGGLPVSGWDWDAVDGWEEQSSTRWGSYAVQGTWDGETLRVTTTPISLALYDPMPVPVEPTEPGSTSEAELQRIHGVLHDALGETLVESTASEGSLLATVVYDDGTLQEHLDGVYGANVVRVSSALRDVAP